jgi:hypothetical protein
MSFVQTTHSPDSAMMKNLVSRAGSLQGPGATWPANLNALSLPVGTLSGGDIFGTFSFPSNVDTTTVFVLAWQGTATNAAGAIKLGRGPPGFTVTFDPGGVVVGSTSQNILASGTNGYIEFNFATSVTTPITLAYVSGSTFSSMTKLIVCRKADYSIVLNPSTPGDLITDDYVAAWRALGPKVLRLGGSFAINDGCSVTQRRYFPAWQNSIFWGSKLWQPSLWVGTPASGTNTYTLSGAADTPAAYTKGEVVQCSFANSSNSTPITVNVAGRGAVPLFDDFGSALTSGGILNNSPYTLIYDDLLGGYIRFASGIGNDLGFMPIEILAAFCNRVGADMWINLPTHITTANSTMEPINSVSQIVSYLSGALTQNLYVEYSNEMWNASGNIGHNTSFAVACGTAFGFTSDNNRRYHGFYGYKVRTIAPIARAAWSSSRTLKMVLAGQGFAVFSTTNLYRLQGNDLASVANGGQGNALWISYTGGGGGANYRSSPDRPVDVCDTLAYATYYSGGQCQNFDATYITGKGAVQNITNISTDATGGVITYGVDPGYSTGVRVVLASITQTGSPTLSGMNVTLTKLTATTYKMFTDATLATGVDTSLFTYTSGGNSQSYRPVSGLTAWADLYNNGAGTPANIASAFSSLDADILGTNNDQTTSALNTTVYPNWESIAAGYDGVRPAGKVNLTIELYEGALESISPSTATCTILGIATSYNAKIDSLLTGYKNSKYFYNRALATINQFMAVGPSRIKTPVWFLAWPGVGNQWSMVNNSARDIYSGAGYQSYYVVRNLNTSRRRLFINT